MQPKQYRKIPVVIEAIEFVYSADGIKALKDFCGNSLISFGKDRCLTAVGWAEIGTLEDGVGSSPQVRHIASEGDFIIRGVSGEFYPCKPDIFRQTYEAVKTPMETLVDQVKDSYKKIQDGTGVDFDYYRNMPLIKQFPIVTCPTCGVNLSGVMGYVCPRTDCPTQPRITC